MPPLASSPTPPEPPISLESWESLNYLWSESFQWHPTDTQRSQLQQLYQEIIQGNRQFNLTRITEPQDFWEKHLWDSISGIAPWLQDDPTPKTVLDIGTGGGFPGLVVAIVCPQWQVTLLDATRKKITFLDQVVQTLNLPNVKTIVGRAETLGRDPRQRQHYDLALIRAVGAAPICAEYALPFLNISGTAVLYRGQWDDLEAATLNRALDTLGGTLQTITPWQTPLTAGVRHCLYVEKVKPTPKTYPRMVGVPSQKPLGSPDGYSESKR